ncbi:MAG: zinc-binding dehydrogenase [Halieaceae bacterium]|nr:zinc-binding dehydrogenase [Halieaceae bacterium]
MKALQMQSCVHENATVECALVEITIPDPKPDEVVVAVEAAPINPSDLGLMFGAADLSTVQEVERNGQPALLLDVPAAAMRAMAPRVGHWMGVGNEGSGRVIAAGDGEAAQALLGQRVGMFGGEMYAAYRCLPAAQCIAFPDTISAEQAASCFVNPMTALGFLETRDMESHGAMVHTAAASNLGQMLVRLCQADKIPLVNIVRSEAQVTLLRDMGAEWVLNTQSEQFMPELIKALKATGATVAFDAIGGGRLVNRILTAMEIAAAQTGPWSRYGSEEVKQAYIYGQLDMSATELTRGYGWVWSVSGWLLTPFMNRAGPDRVARMRKRVVDEIDSTFLSHYSSRLSLQASLSATAVADYGARKTGQKTLLKMTSSTAG